jgi:shikimate kinase
MENQKIKDIFENEGEEYFRDKERKCAKWLSKSVQNAVISTGGGFFKVKNLKKIGIVILLDSSFDAIYERILAHPNADKKLAKRPLFNSPKEAKKLYKERSAQYKEVADLVISVENKNEEEVCCEIYQALSSL